MAANANGNGVVGAEGASTENNGANVATGAQVAIAEEQQPLAAPDKDKAD